MFRIENRIFGNLILRICILVIAILDISILKFPYWKLVVTFFFALMEIAFFRNCLLRINEWNMNNSKQFKNSQFLGSGGRKIEF